MQRLSALLPALLLTVALLAASASAASFDDTSAVLVGGSLAVFASSSSSNGTTLSNGTAASNGTLPVGELGSDGGGGVLRYVWVTYCILLGLPLLLCGFRLTKFTCGAGCCLAICISLWAALVNSTPSDGFASTPLQSDLAILAPTLVLALGALALGWLHAFRYIGHLLLCAAAGVALVLHAVLFKQGLLVESLVGTWVLMGGVGFGLLVVGIWQQRLGVIFAATMTGAFLLTLAVNLILEKEDGMSYGLRVILDSNASALAREDYKPTLKTQVNLAVGLGLVLVMSLVQHFAFPGDFIRRPKPTIWPQLPPSHDNGRSTPFGVFGRRASVASSFEAITPEDPAYHRPWMGPDGAANYDPKFAYAHPAEDARQPVDPISADTIPAEPAPDGGGYATISLHRDSPYALSTADMRAREAVPNVPLVVLPRDEPPPDARAPRMLHPQEAWSVSGSAHPDLRHFQSERSPSSGRGAEEAVGVRRTPSSASSISQYPPTPAQQSSFNTPFTQHPANESPYAPSRTPPVHGGAVYPFSVPHSAYVQADPAAQFYSVDPPSRPPRTTNLFNGAPSDGARAYSPPRSKGGLLDAIRGIPPPGEERRASPSDQRPKARFQPPSQTRL